MSETEKLEKEIREEVAERLKKRRATITLPEIK